MSTFDALKVGRATNPYQQQAASPYLKQYHSGWTVDNGAVSAVANRCGWLSLKSDAISDRIQALDLYQCHSPVSLEPSFTNPSQAQQEREAHFSRHYWPKTLSLKSNITA